MERAARDWSRQRTLRVAGDLLGEAWTLRSPTQVTDAAKWVLDHPAPPSRLLELARRISGESPHPTATARDEQLPATLDSRRAQVGSFKRRVRRFPREAVTWMDLARAYVTNGQDDLAKRPVQIAIALAPTSRFILRSAVRFFLHVQEPETARRLLIACPRTPTDPWLLAAEAATSSVVGKPPHFARLSRRVAASTEFPLLHLSELATAVATIEMEAGAHRPAKRLFQRALLEPTENAVAQVEWATRQDPTIQIPEVAYEVPRAYEALAWNNLHDGRWERIVRAAESWLHDEPFSSRPAIFGSWASMFANRNFKKAQEFAQAGLVTHPGEPLLLNNLAVSLVDLGDLTAAREALAKVANCSANSKTMIPIIATRGLICFRHGLLVEGRAYYREALESARHHKEPWMEVLALLHLAREELSLDPTAAENAARGAAKLLERLPIGYRALADRFSLLSGLGGIVASSQLADSIRGSTAAKPSKR